MLYKMQLALDVVENTRERARIRIKMKIKMDFIQCVLDIILHKYAAWLLIDYCFLISSFTFRAFSRPPYKVKDTWPCRPGESNQQPSSFIKLYLLKSYHNSQMYYLGSSSCFPSTH